MMTDLSTHKFTGKLAWEKPVTEKETVGYFLGLEHGKSKFKGTFTGDQDDLGLSVGGYFIESQPTTFHGWICNIWPFVE